MKNVLQLAAESGQTLLEIFAQVPGSFEEYRTLIRKALKDNPPAEVQGADYCYIEGIVGDFPERVILEAISYDADYNSTTQYFEATVTRGDNGRVIFSDVKEVEIKAAITAKNEMIQLDERTKAENIKLTEFNETVDVTVELQPQNEAAGNSKRTGRVNIAQKADVKNENNRVYPKAVLKEAVEHAQNRINEYGGLMMDSQHRVDATGQNVSDLRETVAVIKQVEFNEQTGEVTLPEIEFVDTQAGKDILALLESGVKLQVSQRGRGTSHSVVNPTTNETYQEVNFLRISGFDFVPGGAASVKEADFESSNEGRQNTSTPPQKTLTEQSSGGGNSQEQQRSNGNPPPEAERILAEAKPLHAELSPEDKALIEKSQAQVRQSQANLDEAQRLADETRRKTEIAQLKTLGETVLEAEVATLTRFNEEQRKLIIAEIKPEKFYDQVTDVFSEEAILTVLKPQIAKEANRLDKTIATTALGELGFPVDQKTGLANRQNGQTRVTVLKEDMPGAELYYKVVNEVTEEIKKNSERDVWHMPDDHEGMKVLESLMDGFLRANYPTLLHENTLSQSDIGGRIATISAMVIPIAWRLTTAFQVIDLEPMPHRILDKKIKIQDQGNNTELDAVTQYANLDPGEGNNITKINTSYLNFPIYATRQALRSEITPYAIATARNTPMQPLVDTVMDIAMDIRNRMDMMFWMLMIVKGLHQETGQVTTVETLKRESTSTVWKSANPAWIPYVWQKTTDAQGNPDTAKFESLAPASGKTDAPTDLGTQGIEVQTSNATPVKLIHGTDYTIDFQQGRIVLTAAGETKRASDNIQAKYTYSKNVSTWSLTPPSGTSLMAHLLTLRRAVGQRRVAIKDRNWQPNALGMNYDIEDLITHNDRMTYLGGSPADLMNQLNEIENYAGLEPIKSSAIPRGWLPVMMKGAACHGVHIPWMFEPPITSEHTGNKFILGQQWSGSDVPVADKLGIVVVTD